MALQTDGRIIIGGFFTSVNNVERVGVARLNPDGSLDPNFYPRFFFGSDLEAIAIQGDGRIVISGQFTFVDRMPRMHMARLVNDPAPQSLTASFPGSVRWLRGGASPEVEFVTFDISTDSGISWSLLGAGSRIAGGWELSGLTLPPGGRIRARGRTVSGYFNGSSGLVESITSFAATPREVWRFQHFGTTENAGPSADQADPDNDGLENLVEYAFGRDPVVPDAAALPAWEWNGNAWSLQVSRPANATDIFYIVEYSSTLAPGNWLPAPGSWLPVPGAGSESDFIFATAPTGPRIYLRVRVAAP